MKDEMKDKMNNILIAILWLLASTMGASFWFNTVYGFNVFSMNHWHYLAYMQASNQPVKTSFYVSLVVTVIIMVVVLYKLLQPRKKKIATHDVARPQPTLPQQPVAQPVSKPQPEPVVQNTQPVANPEPKEAIPAPQPMQPTTLTRPPRLNIPTVSRTASPTPKVPLTSVPPKQTSLDPEKEYADIHEIFTNAGFLYKGSPRIKNVQTSVLAIGTNEILWVGANGVTTADMERVVETLDGVFSDTLDDIEININAFIIGAPDANDDIDNNIMYFADIDELRQFIDENPNQKPDEDDTENFDAYSSYISTVIDYVRKI